MKTSSIIFLSLFLIVSYTSEAGGYEFTASAIVTNSVALFRVPIKPRKTYKYFQKTTPDNDLEYECDISLGRYTFGFFLFKFPGSKQQTGSIEKVLGSGQSSIWVRKGNSSSAVEGYGLSVRYSVPYIVLKIANPLTIDALFKEHTSRCSFKIIGFDAPKNDGEIEIEYSNNE